MIEYKYKIPDDEEIEAIRESITKNVEQKIVMLSNVLEMMPTAYSTDRCLWDLGDKHMHLIYPKRLELRCNFSEHDLHTLQIATVEKLQKLVLDVQQAAVQIKVKFIIMLLENKPLN